MNYQNWKEGVALRNLLCPRCHRYHLRRQTHQLTGDCYYICENYPQCNYVSPMLENDDEPQVAATRPSVGRTSA